MFLRVLACFPFFFGLLYWNLCIHWGGVEVLDLLYHLLDCVKCGTEVDEEDPDDEVEDGGNILQHPHVPLLAL